mmetsp:Transcript_62605/g.167696  ORF Transcript_62605/g.167696 Transcript_62605/m.167696 type:complete len:387 (+) Transcript_62605:26-1186(+)
MLSLERFRRALRAEDRDFLDVVNCLKSELDCAVQAGNAAAVSEFVSTCKTALECLLESPADHDFVPGTVRSLLPELIPDLIRAWMAADVGDVDLRTDVSATITGVVLAAKPREAYMHCAEAVARKDLSVSALLRAVDALRTALEAPTLSANYITSAAPLVLRKVLVEPQVDGEPCPINFAVLSSLRLFIEPHCPSSRAAACQQDTTEKVVSSQVFCFAARVLTASLALVDVQLGERDELGVQFRCLDLTQCVSEWGAFLNICFREQQDLVVLASALEVDDPDLDTASIECCALDRAAVLFFWLATEGFSSGCCAPCVYSPCKLGEAFLRAVQILLHGGHIGAALWLLVRCSNFTRSVADSFVSVGVRWKPALLLQRVVEARVCDCR